MDLKKLTSGLFKRSLILILFLVIDIYTLFSQNKGLSRPQDPSVLPKSRAAVVFPARLPKIMPEPKLVVTSGNEWLISGGWELAAARQINLSGHEISGREYNPFFWINATVPGTILTTLVNNGYYPDPLYGLNNLSIPDTLCRTDWWYRTVLPIPGEAKNKRIQLLFNGINYKAEVWFNGSFVGTIKGAFIRGQFDITHLIRQDGNNVLAVHILPPPHPGIPHEENLMETGANGGLLCYDGPTFVCTEGWDWIPGIRDRNMGIWQDVRLRVLSDARIVDPQVISDLPLPDTSSAKLTIKTSLVNYSDKQENFILSGEIENIKFSKQVTLKARETRLFIFNAIDFPQLNIQKPRLWWPNGYGNQELYNLRLALTEENNILTDTKEVKFGIREMSYDFTVDYQYARQNVRVNLNPLKVWGKTEKIITYRMHGYDSRHLPNGVQIGFVPDLKDTVLFDKGITPGSAPYLVIQVNGQPIYCRGGNWGLDEAMKRVSREKMEPFFRLHKDEGFTMIRNWVGQSTEEIFYQLADEYGLLIWNDFWMSTENYNLDPWDNQLLLDNARDVIRRFRNHPSIAVWCGRNEGNPPMDLDDSLHILQAKEDGTRIYHSSSIRNNLTNSGPWFYTDFVNKEIHHKDGFNTETGSPAIPVAETMREMMAPEDLWPIGDVWYYHDLHKGQTDYIKAIEDQYGPYKNIDEFCIKAQMLNYEIYREIFEVWNYRLWNNCSGLLLWMSHPAWPSTVWQTYSSDYETNGVYYGSRKACEPLHIQFQPDKDDIYFINNTLHNYDRIKTELKIYDLTGREIYIESAVNDSKANSRIKCFVPKIPGILPAIYLVRMRTITSEGVVLSENAYFRSNSNKKDFKGLDNLAPVTLKGKLAGKKLVNRSYISTITLTNPSKVMAVSIKLNVRDAITGKRILPAYISDGYFTLLPGETRIVVAEFPAEKLAGSVKITAEGLNVPLQDIIQFKL
jgi:hypothetical protein